MESRDSDQITSFIIDNLCMKYNTSKVYFVVGANTQCRYGTDGHCPWGGDKWVSITAVQNGWIY